MIPSLHMRILWCLDQLHSLQVALDHSCTAGTHEPYAVPSVNDLVALMIFSHMHCLGGLCKTCNACMLTKNQEQTLHQETMGFPVLLLSE